MDGVHRSTRFTRGAGAVLAAAVACGCSPVARDASAEQSEAPPRVDAATASARTDDDGGGREARRSGLTPTAVQSVIAKHLGAVRGCFESGPLPAGVKHPDVTVMFVISPAGDVVDVSTVTATAGPTVAECVLDRMRTWVFPKADGTTSVTYPFVYLGRASGDAGRG